MAAIMKYDPDWHDDWAWSLALRGATDQDVADAFGIAKRTVIRWKTDHPTFAQAYQRGKDVADSKVEKSLYQRAIGYSVDETEKIIEVDPKTGNTKPVRVKTTTKHIVPDTMACMYWLNNRSNGKWAQQQKVSLSAEEGGGDVVIYIPENGRDGNEQSQDS